MNIVVNLSPDKSPWPRFKRRIFKKYQCVIKNMLPPEYKAQSKLITQRAFDPLWFPLHRLADSILVFEFTKDDVNNGMVKCCIPQHVVHAKLDQALKVMHQAILDHTVILMGLPFVCYTTEVKETFYAYLELELRAFITKLWLEAVAYVNQVVIRFTGGNSHEDSLPPVE